MVGQESFLEKTNTILHPSNMFLVFFRIFVCQEGQPVIREGEIDAIVILLSLQCTLN